MTLEEFDDLREGEHVRSDVTEIEWIVTRREGNIAILTAAEFMTDEDCDLYTILDDNSAPGPAHREAKSDAAH